LIAGVGAALVALGSRRPWITRGFGAACAASCAGAAAILITNIS
jgi:hypothetical protein